MQTYNKFESHFRVSPHILSTGFNVLIHLVWAQMKPHPPLVPASDRLPSRAVPRGQTERTHLDLVGGSNTPSSPVGYAGVQAKRPGPKRAGARDGGSAASLMMTSSCRYNRGKIEQRVAQSFTAHVAIQRGLAECPQPRHPSCSQPVSSMR